MIQNEISSDFRLEISSYNFWPNYSNLHSHNHYELYFLLQGSTYFLIENRTVEIQECDIVWIPPHMLHITRPRDTERHKKVGFYISPSFMERCLGTNPDMTEFFSQYHVLSPADNDKSYFRRLANLLIEEYLNQQPYSLQAIQGLFTTTLAHIRRIYETSLQTEEKASPKPQTPMEIKLLLSYINNNFKNDITRTTLSEQVNMSQVYISSLFKKHLGFTFKEYLLDLRIKAAMEMLKSTNDSVENIAYACGFNSSNHFCKTFKKMVSMPPKMFREVNLKK